MVMVIGWIIGISILLYQFKKKFDLLHDVITSKIDQIGDVARIALPSAVVSGFGGTIANLLMSLVGGFLRRK